MNSTPAPRILSSLLIALLVLAPLSAIAGGLAFVSGKEKADILTDGPNLSVLTWNIPGGVLVADRIPEGSENRFGPAMQPVYPSSEWYLIQPKGHGHPTAEIRAGLADLGRIHLEEGDVLVVEIPRAGLDVFAQMDLNRVRIQLDSPPRGWDQVRDYRDTAPIDAAKAGNLIEDFVDQVSQPAFFQTIQEISGAAYFWHGGSLQSVSSRYYNTADKDLVADFLKARLEGFGYTVEFDGFTYNGHPCKNIVATKLGTTYPDEYVVMGGHYDSTSPSPGNAAPGAEDNGSGTAGVVEVARIAANRDFERSIQFVLFDAEEQGLHGSQHFVSEAVSGGRDIVGAVITDMIAYFDTHYATRIEGEHSWEWLMSIMENSVVSYTEIGKQKDYNSWGSDHVPFQQAGIPAFLAIDYDYGSYPGYHQTTDTWSQIAGTAQIGTNITRACAATVAEVAGLQSDVAAATGDLPSGTRVHLSAHPNPFNPQVTIGLDLREAVQGELAIFDVSGRKIATLASGQLAAGAREFTWNGRDLHGNEVGSGTYLCRLQSDIESQNLKLNLIR